VLAGPGGTRLEIGASRTLCLSTPGRYVLLARPVRLGPWATVYPTVPVGALAVERLPFAVPPQARLELFVHYLDVAPNSTLVLPAGSVAVPAGRQLPYSGAFRLRTSRLPAPVRAGDVIVEPVTSGLAAGVLARVTSVTDTGAFTSVVTAPASPFVAFTRATESIELHPDGATRPLVAHFSKTGGAIRPRQLGVSCSALSASGSVSFMPSASFQLSWSDPDLFDPEVTGSFSVSPGLSGSLTLSSTAGVNCSASVNLATVPVGEFCTEFGCLTVNLLANADVGGSLGEAFSQTITEQLQGSAGASFRFGATTPSFSTSNTLSLTGSSNSSPPGWIGSVSAGVGPAIQVLYGIPDVAGVGPQLGLLDQATLSGSSSGWQLDGGITGSVGIALDALGLSYEQGATFPISSVELDHGTWSAAPSPPQDVAVTGSTSSSLAVSWQPPEWPGLGGLGGYSVSATPAGSTTPATTVPAPASATSAELTGLSGGTAYTVSVSATSGGSTGRAATASGSTEAATPPGAPDLTSAQASFNSSFEPVATITYSPPANDGGSGIVSYTIDWSGDGTSGSDTITSSQNFYISTIPLPAFLPPLTEGGETIEPYSVTVSATNAVGTGPPSAVMTFDDVTTPGPPPSVRAIGGSFDLGGTTQPGAIVSWQPSNDGGEAVTSYTIAYSGGGRSGTVSVAEPNPSAPVTTATIALPSYGTSYLISVGGVNSVTGPTDPIETTSTTVTSLTVPGAPSGLSVVEAGGSVTASWDAPSNDGGSPITSYELGWTGAGERDLVPSSTTSATFSVPEGGVAYHFGVYAENAQGLGPSSPLITLTPNGPPGPPTALSVELLKFLHVYSVSWSPPSVEGGAPIESYVVSWAGSSEQVVAPRTSVDLPPLAGGRYVISVRATNRFGTGIAATTSIVVLGSTGSPGPRPKPT
jgi:hypothetical protein